MGRVGLAVRLRGRAGLLEAGEPVQHARAGLADARPRGVVEGLAQLVAQGRHPPEEDEAGPVAAQEVVGLRGHARRQHAGHVLHAGHEQHREVGLAEAGLALGRGREQHVHPGVGAGPHGEAGPLDGRARVQAEEQGQRQVEQDVLRVPERGRAGRAPHGRQALLQEGREGARQRAAGQDPVRHEPQVRQQAVVRGVGDGQDEPARVRDRQAGPRGEREVGVELALGRVGRHRAGAGQAVEGLDLAVQLGVVGEVG